MHRVRVEKPEGKRPLGIARRRCENNITMDGVKRCAQVSGREN
jgi:hypothetical protein